MKKIVSIVLILCLTAILYAQNSSDTNRDYVWKIGYEGFYRPTDTLVGSVSLNFSHNPVQINVNSDSAGMNASNASICDSSGNLLFYTNGIFIYGADGHTLRGNDTLNLGYYSSCPNYCETGYPFMQSVLILPLPNSNHLYYVFHQRSVGDTPPDLPIELYYSIVDMAAENGRGRVVSLRNRVFNEDQLAQGRVNSARHANGRDWWITQWHIDRTQYRRILLDPLGVHDLGWQSGIPSTPELAYWGQSTFSPNGAVYAAISVEESDAAPLARGRIDVYNFDRCEGTMSRRAAPFYIGPTGIGADTFDILVVGCSISPNNRYLYVSTTRRYYQYDLQATDIANSHSLVAEWDGFIDPDFPVATGAWLHQLAPDGKIYISTGNGTHYLHTINAPDSAGIACNVQQHSIRLPAFNFRSLPNHPNYRLGRLVGSSCDTITVGSKQVTVRQLQIRVFPNPTNGIIYLENLPENATIEVFNSIGQLLQIQNNQTAIDLSSYPNSIYFINIKTNDSNITRKVVLQR
jgi:hypothetical protein